VGISLMGRIFRLLYCFSRHTMQISKGSGGNQGLARKVVACNFMTFNIVKIDGNQA
jgi:hypothetical protein